MKGRHVLRKIDFSPNWINDANHRALNLLERKRVVFPSTPIEGGMNTDKLHKAHKNVEEMIIQILNITPTETRTGKIHFDLPDSGGGYVKRKDMYSTFIMACNLAYEIEEESLRPRRSIMHGGFTVPILRI